jgi:LysW-gamma-L-lysine/LysW-L-ornithine aminotransferase
LDIFTIEDRHASGLYAKHHLTITSGHGATLCDAQGREYIDCMGAQGAANLGHAHPQIASAITRQASRLLSLPETFYNDQRAALVERLARLAPGLERVFLCNSGTEAVEAALKFARLSTGRPQIVAAMRGFHGRTLGALSATWNKAYREPFEPLVPGFQHVPYNNPAAMEAAIGKGTAAVILETIQGEGGVHLAQPGYLEAVERLCRQNGALLILDEVQTGYGRTGKMLACEHDQVKPDMICLAKSMAGGLPMGAVLIGCRVDKLSPGMHGSTFGGNPLACAAALAVLEVMEHDHLAEQAAEKGAYLLEKLNGISSPLIREIRGRGLMIGIELKKKAAPYLQAMEAQGVIALQAGPTVIRLLPPLVITFAQLDTAAALIERVLTQPSG